jgi:hypothetical protein
MPGKMGDPIELMIHIEDEYREIFVNSKMVP